MKKFLSFLLALCMLIPLAVMAEVGNCYYMGNYAANVERDFNQALSWFLRAAEGGDTSVYMNIANIYEKGSTGERSYEKAYDWFRRAAELGSKEAEERMAAPAYASMRWKDDAAALTGQLGEYGNLGGRYGTPFYLDKPVLDCSLITLQLGFIQYRGWPFGQYGLFAQTLNGDWVEVQRFQIETSTSPMRTPTMWTRPAWASIPIPSSRPCSRLRTRSTPRTPPLSAPRPTSIPSPKDTSADI